MSSNGRGRLFIVSAPSGAGKTTVVRKMIVATPSVMESISYTTRPIRPGEVAGVDYHFIDADRFVALRDAGGFLEWAEVFGDHYGTGAADTDRSLSAGLDVVLVIDVQGARKVRASGLPGIGIFLLPPSFHELEARLRARGRDPEAAIRRRLVTARDEMNAVDEYDYVVVNDEIDGCVDRVRAIVLAERSRREAMADQTATVAASFLEKARG